MGHTLQGSEIPSEYRRIGRVLAIVQYIATQPSRWKRKTLARHFDLSERQIQKDLDVIRHRLGLELRHDGTGYYFPRMPRLPAVSYSFSEALALLLAARASQQVVGIDSAELAAAIARLETLFPSEFAPLLHQVTTRPPVTAQGEHRQEMLALLNRALITGLKVRMVYETRSRGGEASERVVRPYYIMPYVRSWQLIAYCERRQNVLMFKVDRIREAILLDERYQVPHDFDLEQYMGATWGLMRGQAGEPVEVLLKFGAEAGRWVAEEYWHPSQQAEEQPDGCVLLRLHLAITPEFVSWLLYYGPRVEVLQPGDLREWVAREHAAAAGIYHIHREPIRGGQREC